MNYVEYHKFCLNGRQCPVDIENFTYKVLDLKFDTKEIHSELFHDIDKIAPLDWIKKVPFKQSYLAILKPVLEPLLNVLEANYYGCSIFVDKLYIYRSVPFSNRTSSAIYHYDNTPPTQLKTIIYLDDVLDDSDGPIEFCQDFIKKPTRLGPGYNEWTAPPNNSRLTDSEVAPYKKIKIYGVAGTSTLFYPSCVHRANPPYPNKTRDVINILTQPTTDKEDRYKYVSGFESNGSPLMDPTKRRK